MIIKKCLKCGKLIEEIKTSPCDTICCGEAMVELKPNTTDAAAEKHIPTYEIRDGKILARVNHVMEKDHYIEWIKFEYKDRENTYYFKPGDEPVAHCKYEEGMKLYSYCNKHGLWMTEVK